MIALIIGMVAVFAVLPRMIDGPPVQVRTERPTEEPIPPLETPNPAQPTEIPRTDDGLRRTVNAALDEGNSALDARDPQTAATAFRRASTLDPGNTAADQGLRRAEALAALMIFENKALAFEKRGQIEAATAAARRALELDPNSRSARGVADRMAVKLRQKSYQELVTRGLAALKDEQYEKALDAFSAAAERQPSAPEVTDGLTRAHAGLKRQAIAGHVARATESEGAENWQQAVSDYRAALALDPDLAAARSGLHRSEDRLQIAQRMIYHLENPTRLSTAEVLKEAQELADKARAVAPQGPRHQALVARLDALITSSSTPIPVILESDGRTEVVLYRFGQLGVFERHEVELRPGTYTAVGRRSGYRDVRVEFLIRPGAPPEPIVIRCTEGI